MYFSVVFLFVLNTFIVQGTSTGSLSFYTDQEHQALQLCSQEYQTVLGELNFLTIISTLLIKLSENPFYVSFLQNNRVIRLSKLQIY